MRNYNPWGKGGGGAPLRDAKGNLISMFARTMGCLLKISCSCKGSIHICYFMFSSADSALFTNKVLVSSRCTLGIFK